MKALIIVSSLFITSLCVAGARSDDNADSDKDASAKAVATVSADRTKHLLGEFVEVTSPNFQNHVVGPVDVKGFKTVRVAVTRGACGPCSADPVRVLVYAIAPPNVLPAEQVIDAFLIETRGEASFSLFAARTYDVPGHGLRLAFANQGGSFRDQVAVSVFGRAN